MWLFNAVIFEAVLLAADLREPRVAVVDVETSGYTRARVRLGTERPECLPLTVQANSRCGVDHALCKHVWFRSHGQINSGMLGFVLNFTH